MAKTVGLRTCEGMSDVARGRLADMSRAIIDDDMDALTADL